MSRIGAALRTATALVALCGSGALGAAMNATPAVETTRGSGALGAAMTEPVLAPYVATYSVARGNFRLGQTTMTLDAPVDGVWTLTSSSEASGLASLFTNVSIEERSRFRIEDGLPVPLSHEYQMARSKKNRDFSLAFDWVERVVTGDVRGEPASEPLSSGAVDRHTAPLAVALAAAGAREFPYEFVMVDRARTRHYTATLDGEEFMDAPGGKLATVRVRLMRVDEPERQFRFWFAPALDYAPVRIRSVDDDGDTVTLQLTSFTRK